MMLYLWNRLLSATIQTSCGTRLRGNFQLFLTVVVLLLLINKLITISL